MIKLPECSIQRRHYIERLSHRDVLLYDSDETATYRNNVSGWVSRKGFFYPDESKENSNAEHLARSAGATHKICSGCQLMLIPSNHYMNQCRKCLDKEMVKRHNKREAVEWDGEGFIYSWLTDKYFAEPCDIDDYIDAYPSSGLAASDLLLSPTKPVHLRDLDVEYWCDDMPSNVDDFVDALDILSPQLLAAIDHLNKIMN